MTKPLKNDWVDTGTILLDKGMRQSVIDDSVDFQDRDHLMRILQYNLEHRQKKRRPKGGKRRDRLRGLFGSTR